jgi:hypothetical protein
MQSERLAIGPLNQRDIERVAVLLLRGLARKPVKSGMRATGESSDGGIATVTHAQEPPNGEPRAPRNAEPCLGHRP